MEQFELIAKTFQGLEEVLAQELTELGADNVQIGRRMVSFTGDKETMYRANFCLRTAVRILKPILHFTAHDADDVYNAVRTIDWREHLDVQTSFAVDSVVFSQEFRHSKFVAYKVKDAIVDFFRETTGERPSIRISNPDIRLNVHIAEDQATLSLDSSGESLHLRGYREATVEAPINEVLAAGLLKLAGWKGETDLIDPFCGSGTILIEAALMARNIYPGVFRKSFGFEKWKDFDRDILDRIYNDDSQERTFHHHIYGYDLNLHAIEAAERNVKSAGVADCISLEQRDVRKFTKPEAPAIIVSNPPYGERLTSPDLLNVYHALGERLKHEFTGGEAWIICSRQECFEQMGLKPSFKVPLVNGALECELRKYQLFSGKLDAFRAAGGDIKTDYERRRMGEKHRFKQNRGNFTERFSDREEEEELPENYTVLRNRHRDFERFFDRKTKADRPDRPADKRDRDRNHDRKEGKGRPAKRDGRPHADGVKGKGGKFKDGGKFKGGAGRTERRGRTER